MSTFFLLIFHFFQIITLSAWISTWYSWLPIRWSSTSSHKEWQPNCSHFRHSLYTLSIFCSLPESNRLISFQSSWTLIALNHTYCIRSLLTCQSFWKVFHWLLAIDHGQAWRLFTFHPFWYLHLSFFPWEAVGSGCRLDQWILLGIYRGPCVWVFGSKPNLWKCRPLAECRMFHCTWSRFRSSWILYRAVSYQSNRWCCHFSRLQKLRIPLFILQELLIWQTNFQSTYQLSFYWGKHWDW